MTPMLRCILPVLLMVPTAGLTASLDEGQAIFADICADCHKADGSGDLGPDIRGRARTVVRRALRGFDEMPEITLTDPELDALMLYIDALDS